MRMEKDPTAYGEWSGALSAALAPLRQGRAAESAALLRGLLERLAPDECARGRVLEALGRALFAQGEPQAAEAALRESVDLLRRSRGAASPEALAALQNLAHLLLERGDLAQSQALGQEAAELCAAAEGPQSPRLATALLHLSAAYYRQRDFAGAERCLTRARDIFSAQRPAPPELGTCLNNLARLREEQGNAREGIALHRQALALRQRLLGEDHEDTVFSQGNLGVALASDGQWAEAAAALDRALEGYARLGKGAGPEASGYRRNLEVCRRAMGEEAAPGKAACAGGSAGDRPAEARERLLREIVERELEMFLATPNEGGPAVCQQRPEGFRIMRRMTLGVLREATLAAYADDLRRAAAAGRNLMVEKYARMDDRLPPVREDPRMDALVAAESAFMDAAAKAYPHVIRRDAGGGFARYLRCELETLSPGTLAAYGEDVAQARREGRNLAVERYRVLARLLGKPGLEALEAAAAGGAAATLLRDAAPE
ncbi:DUF4125 family protein [Desulfovibrio legallii]|uniref:Tetratricopeptide repeat-containing protein n=1 Tax=Desulfovibrio legallii TaxID=571438 RepID=A0A1G7JPL6_9BACT|nr:DUF4125 family protein [Desulfovibrio legallii]SDF26826.1 Tetratricopeptide repeat-containing protein [Desulfovibrio legallii]